MTGIARHTPELTGNRAIRLINADTALLPDVSDTLASLVDESVWLEVGDTVENIVNECWQILTDYYALNLIGAVSYFLVSLPTGWLPMDGVVRLETDYPELHAALPAHLKTATQFTLPNAAGCFVEETATSATIGTLAGQSSYSLTIGQLAAHTHTEVPAIPAGSAGGAGPPIPTTGVGSPIATSSTGSGSAIDNRPNFINLVMGVYAGRP